MTHEGQEPHFPKAVGILPAEEPGMASAPWTWAAQATSVAAFSIQNPLLERCTTMNSIPHHTLKIARVMILIALAVAVLPSKAHAQRGGHGGFGGGGAHAAHWNSIAGHGMPGYWHRPHTSIWIYGTYLDPYAGYYGYPAYGYGYGYQNQDFGFFNPYLFNPSLSGPSNFDFLFP
jgi:hypothetical protein